MKHVNFAKCEFEFIFVDQFQMWQFLRLPPVLKMKIILEAYHLGVVDCYKKLTCTGICIDLSLCFACEHRE